MALTGSMKKALKTDIQRILDYMCLSPAGLAIGTVSKKEVLIANTVTYLVAGVPKTKTTAEVAFTATTHDIPANASSVQERCFTYSLDASGTCTVTAGGIATGSGKGAVPDPPAGESMIGYLRLAVAAGATPFNATTDDLDSAHLTDTYVDRAYPE